jgi:hypothetical protein
MEKEYFFRAIQNNKADLIDHAKIAKALLDKDHAEIC